MTTISLLCGGPSQERGISLNSARSFLDQIKSWEVSVTVFYQNPFGAFYPLSAAQLYSNTPSDFDFKLAQSTALKEEELLQELKKVDLVFPLIHGIYGEDGTLQRMLELNNIPFVGSSSHACKRAFNKQHARSWLSHHQFKTLPSLFLKNLSDSIAPFWKENQLTRGVLKPTESGSSIGVIEVDSPSTAQKALNHLLSQGFRQALLEPYCEDREFTICVLESPQGPVPLIPLEIDTGSNGMFDYRKKYLPSDQTRYYCPPRFSPAIIEKIREEAKKLFELFNLSDFARIDGWVSKEGAIRFSDLNPISGMEQNSFLFQQAARLGLTHADLVGYIINSALRKVGKKQLVRLFEKKPNPSPIFVLMGGETSEREVSLMSGTNVWLKLLQEKGYSPTPFLLAKEGRVWQLPYSFALHHTVEEIEEHCLQSEMLISQTSPWIAQIRNELQVPPLESTEKPVCHSLVSFINKAKEEKAFVFIALHGGMGENGTLQKLLEENKVPFNGSSSTSSYLCMDKGLTAQCIEQLNNSQILPIPQISFHITSLGQIPLLWERALSTFKHGNLLIKPQHDGCSTGVIPIRSEQELFFYFDLILNKAPFAPVGTFPGQRTPISLPTNVQPFLLQPFIETDTILLKGTQIQHIFKTGWLEITVGVLENRGHYTALNPSISVAENHVLSVEEKFQGGTGVNITPPPKEILPLHINEIVKKNVCLVAEALKIRSYGRIDLFVECTTGTIQVIEANTLPALTPSTVLYHQALSASPPITPPELISQIIKSSCTFKN